MKAGAAYEQFIYEKFKQFYIDLDVKINDKIIGKQSGIKREIDVSVSGIVQGIPLLYVVQCKDHNKPADVKILGEFSAVIKDVGASKGFLICTSGFTKTIHQYAKTVGIELLTVEDINSSKWKADIEIPFLYEKSQIKTARMQGAIHPNEELVARNKENIKLIGNEFHFISFDNGTSAQKLSDYINERFSEVKEDIYNGQPLSLNDPSLKICIAEIWVQASFKIEFGIARQYFLKYLRPDEFTQFINHVTGNILPTNFKFNAAVLGLDESYIEVDAENIPVFTNLNFHIEEHQNSIGDLVLSTMVLD